jgi:hypothetical protein
MAIKIQRKEYVMSTLEQVEAGIYSPVLDAATLEEVLREAVRIATLHGGEIEVSFHGRTIKVCADSDLKLLARDYERCRWGFIQQVGPYPDNVSEEKLSAEQSLKGWSYLL